MKRINIYIDTAFGINLVEQYKNKGWKITRSGPKIITLVKPEQNLLKPSVKKAEKTACTS
jgi:hypothetical protein